MLEYEDKEYRKLKHKWKIMNESKVLHERIDNDFVTKLFSRFVYFGVVPVTAMVLAMKGYSPQSEEHAKDLEQHALRTPTVLEIIRSLPDTTVRKIEKKAEQIKQEEPQYTQDEIDVARVIYSEAGPGTDKNEREMVASVMAGRIGHRGFNMGKHKTLRDVAYNKIGNMQEFSAINDNKNTNWNQTENPEKLTGSAKDAWDESLYYAKNARPKYGSNGKPLVYYHTNSIKKPKNWDNRYWTAIPDEKTTWHQYYTVEEK